MRALLSLMRTVPLFNGLSDEQLQRLVAISEEEIFNAGDVIVQQGAAGNKLYVIADGQVEVRVRSAPGQPERSELFLGRGQIFGEMALLDEGPRSATVRCSRDHTVLRSIRAQAFNALCRADTAIGYVVMRNIARDLSFKLRHSNLTAGSSAE